MIIWITGASTGIGRSLALKYCENGASVFATARSANKLKQLEKDAENLKGSLYIFSADVTNQSDIEQAYVWLVQHLGTPDKVILNAGTYFPTPAATLNAEEHGKIMDVNYMGVLNCMETILPTMRENKAGQIAIVASVAGYRGLPNASAYSASKAALIAFSESLKEDLKSDDIDLKLINPGFVKTPLTDQNDFSMPFLMHVEDAVETIINGLEKKAFEIAFPTPFALIMKLLNILPNWAYFAVARKIVR
ncbi:SDR family NAD(P)-dependent oxidoreductase [Kordiimonas laminariae]|uniref:SDR family NAD(P)-dependent oxidoreductase n=1 Tax=Kordiimonas laminariae TaxID=2917717 RepID=UPI001FF4A98D|nr:SDR family NAD(P)-dependent oxidoreductase [Kordiimonas laminariae]MCK0070885.1 SDR family NAD(P)-dependent oxidoreductase [Kordiimonas laminariae]